MDFITEIFSFHHIYTFRHNPQLKDRAGDGGSLSRSSVGTLPEVNTKSLYDEIARLQENIDKKDSMLSMLTEGLKEVWPYYKPQFLLVWIEIIVY